MLSNEDIGLPVVRANNIVDGKFEMETDVKYWYAVDPQGAQTSNYFVCKDDILINFINSESRMGSAAIVPNSPTRDTIYTTNILNLRTNEYAKPYFVYTLTFTKKYQDYISAITKPAVSQASFTTVDFKNYEFGCPCVREQTAIGSFFATLDHTITLHKQKLDGLRTLKKGYLQQMFPQAGEVAPRARFAGFSGEWEMRKLEDFSIKSGMKNSDDEKYPAYSVSNSLGLIPQNEQFEESRLDDLDKTAYKIVEPNEFAYNPARINVGSIAFNNLDKRVIISSLYVIVKMSSMLDNEFILQFIKSPRFIKEVRRNTEGSVREYLFYDNFKNILFPLAPTIEEQVAIGKFLRNIDTQIAAQQSRIEQLQQLKKAYLQKMFV